MRHNTYVNESLWKLSIKYNKKACRCQYSFYLCISMNATDIEG